MKENHTEITETFWLNCQTKAASLTHTS